MIYDANVGIGISIWILARTNVGLKSVYIWFFGSICMAMKSFHLRLSD